ncbi:MAG: helix-turn-helix domain-containing protein [Candidatus Woesearchaeota archaeon]
MGLPVRLRELRKEKGLYQKDVANDIGLTSSAIGFYEQGKRRPDQETLERLADHYNVSVDYLLGRTNERKSADEIKKAISDDPELLRFWEKLTNRPDLQLLLKQTEELEPEDIKSIIEVIRIIHKEEEKEDY